MTACVPGLLQFRYTSAKGFPLGEAGARSAADEGTGHASLAAGGPSSAPVCALGHLPPQGEGFWEAVFPGSPGQRADPPSASMAKRETKPRPPGQCPAAAPPSPAFRARRGSA